MMADARESAGYLYSLINQAVLAGTLYLSLSKVRVGPSGRILVCAWQHLMNFLGQCHSSKRRCFP